MWLAIRMLTSLCACVFVVCYDRECVFNNYAAFAQNPVFRDQFLMEITLLEVRERFGVRTMDPIYSLTLCVFPIHSLRCITTRACTTQTRATT